jgi:hypothetical protein
LVLVKLRWSVLQVIGAAAAIGAAAQLLAKLVG